MVGERTFFFTVDRDRRTTKKKEKNFKSGELNKHRPVFLSVDSFFLLFWKKIEREVFYVLITPVIECT